MTDIRLQRMAQVLVHYSLGIKKGDRLGIMTGPNAAPLVREVVHEAIRAGAFPETFVDLPGVREIVLKEGSDELLSYIPASQRLVLEEYETMLSLLSLENTKTLSGIDPTRMALVQQSRRDLMHACMHRSANGS